MRRILTPSLLACLVVAGGCANRGADDRVTVDETARAVNHGPGYTVVALRHSDRARLSNGAVIINPAGEEPVYVLDAGYTRAPLGAVTSNQQETAELLERVDGLLAALPPAPMPTPAPTPPPGPARPATPPQPPAVPASPAASQAPAPQVVAPPPAVAPAPSAATVVPGAPPEAPQALQAAQAPSQGPSGAAEPIPASSAAPAAPASSSLGVDPAGEATPPASNAAPTYPWRELHKDRAGHPVPAARAP